MKTILKIHPLCYIVIFIYILTGMFRPFIWITSLILVHELGHILAGKIFNWNIEKVIIMPIGGITIFKETLNRSINEELLIAVMGPIFQIIYYLIIKEYISYDWFYYAHIVILLFNLLPMIPLDGSKILNCILEIYLSFYLSNKITIIISVILLSFCIIGCIISKNLIITIIISCILLKILDEIKNQELKFNKFLLERYLYNFRFKKTKEIKSEKLMKRNYNHIFNINNKIMSEKKYLNDKFSL